MWCFAHFDFEMCFAPQRRALFQNPNLQKWRGHMVFCTFWLGNVLRATTACTFSTSQLPKVVTEWCVLYILTWKRASRHNGMHFFKIRTSKSGADIWCFVHIDFDMCFAPQRRALFQHLNFQTWSENGVFCTFWLRHVLRATTACTFSTSQLPKVVRSWCVLYILTWTCASRHNGVHFFISHLASWLRTRRFSEPTFRPSWATNHWKNTVFRDFPTFSRICIFFLLTLPLLLFFLISFSSLCLFPALLFICPYCRKFDFKTSFDDGSWSGAHLSFWDLWRSLSDAIHSVGSGGRDLGLTSLRISQCWHEFLFLCWSGYIESRPFSPLHHSRVNQKKSLVGCASALPSFLFERTAKPGGNLCPLYSLSDFNLSALKKEGRNKESHM